MTNFFVTVFIGSIIIGIVSAHTEPRNQVNYDNWFYNTPEQNQKSITSERSVFRSLLINGALVLLVLLSYWIYL